MSAFIDIVTNLRMRYKTASISFEFWADKELYIRTGLCGMDDYMIHLDKENKSFLLELEYIEGDLSAHEARFISFVLNLLQEEIDSVLEEVSIWRAI